MQNIPSVVPENFTGKAIDLQESVTLPSPELADSHYDVSRQKLLRPFLWNNITGSGSAEFAIVADGQNCVRELVEGDYLRIDIPGPGTNAGDGYDWVRIEKIQKDVVPVAAKSMAVMLRASPNPLGKKTTTAHFFTNDATSTFILELNGATVTLSYYGRNETPNTNDNTVIDNLRNQLVATGAMLGFSAVQWSALLKGLLDK